MGRFGDPTSRGTEKILWHPGCVGENPRRAGMGSGDQREGTWAGGCGRRPGVGGGACRQRCRKGIGG
jgi:hypothetical protein